MVRRTKRHRTIAQRLIIGLIERGWSIDPAAASTKYTVMTHPEQVNKYYVGRYGALRWGKTTRNSTPHDRVKADLLNSVAELTPELDYDDDLEGDDQ